MQIKIVSQGMEISVPIRDYVHEKVSKLEEFYKNIQKVEVVLQAKSIDNADRRQVAEIRAWMGGLKMIQAEEGGKDIYAAIDMALDEAKRQIEKHKEKQVHEQRRKAEKIKQLYRENHEPEGKGGPALIKLDRFAKKPMKHEDAIAELKTLGTEFLAFHNVDSGEFNVIRRNKESFDLLRPEKDMTTEEALQELERSGSEMLLFNNSETNSPNLVFQRKSGNFGLIEPEF
jgi:putative sigma-54 modulation protein